MEGPQMALPDFLIKLLKPRDKAYKAADERGLCLMVTPAGARLAGWRRSCRWVAIPESV
jgi:hypothetical protein